MPPSNSGSMFPSNFANRSRLRIIRTASGVFTTSTTLSCTMSLAPSAPLSAAKMPSIPQACRLIFFWQPGGFGYSVCYSITNNRLSKRMSTRRALLPENANAPSKRSSLWTARTKPPSMQTVMGPSGGVCAAQTCSSPTSHVFFCSIPLRSGQRWTHCAWPVLI